MYLKKKKMKLVKMVLVRTEGSMLYVVVLYFIKGLVEIISDGQVNIMGKQFV